MCLRVVFFLYLVGYSGRRSWSRCSFSLRAGTEPLVLCLEKLELLVEQSAFCPTVTGLKDVKLVGQEESWLKNASGGDLSSGQNP